ncbi:MAG: DUF1642 domain-containing protein [Streptococcus salivarius]|jgi:hypothetical protein|nr:DUF1642 domain-containing protein [Streptococcus salivarius]MDU6700193.1 DUF1642 domain-containing protein [Streptococcus salivarius]
MMNKNEAVQKLATAGRLSIAHAEDLYDSLVPKPVVPQYVADWYEKHKGNFETNLFRAINLTPTIYREGELSEFQEWIVDEHTKPFQTLVNMHQFGYEVEKETKYRVSVKAITDEDRFLKREKDENVWYFGDSSAIGILHHTRKELEANGFGWVFNCPGVEVKEVTDE